MKARKILAILLALMMLVLSACGGSSGSSSGSSAPASSGSSSGSAAATAAKVTAQEYDAVAAVSLDFTTMDPVDTSDTLSGGIQRLIMDGMFGFDDNLRQIPLLATGYTAHEDATEYVITLRQRAASPTAPRGTRKPPRRTSTSSRTRPGA